MTQEQAMINELAVAKIADMQEEVDKANLTPRVRKAALEEIRKYVTALNKINEEWRNLKKTIER